MPFEHHWHFWCRHTVAQWAAAAVRPPAPEPEPVVIDEKIQQQAKQLWRRFSMLQTRGNQWRFRRNR